jgi:hypothetical protein
MDGLNTSHLFKEDGFSWIYAGKPNLKSVYHFKRKLCKELKAYKKNRLLQNGLLRAKKE